MSEREAELREDTGLDGSSARCRRTAASTEQAAG